MMSETIRLSEESQATAELRKDAWLKNVTAKLSAAFARDGERGLLNAEFAVQENCGPPVYLQLLRTQNDESHRMFGHGEET